MLAAGGGAGVACIVPEASDERTGMAQPAGQDSREQRKRVVDPRAKAIDSSVYSLAAGRSLTHFRPFSMGTTRFSRFHTR